MFALLRALLRMMSHRSLFSMISLISALALTGLVGLAVSPTTAATGATYYVAPNGDDSNPGTIDRPWRTIQKAANTLVAGDTVYLRAGTYGEQVNFTRSGSSNSPITFEAYAGETPIVDGTGVSLASPAVDNGLFDFGSSGVHDIVIRGLHMRNSAGCFIEGNNVARIRLYDLNLDNSFSSLIRWQGSTNCVIENIKGHNCSKAYPGSTDGAEGIRIYGGSGVTIRNCEVWDFYNMAVDLFGGHSGGLVEDNYFHDDLNSYDWDAAIYLDGARNSIIRRNIVHNAHIGVQIGAEQPNEPVQNNIVVNNVFYNNINGAIVFKGRQSTSHTTNNLVAHNTGINGPRSRNPVMWIKENSHDNQILNNILVAQPGAQSYELVRIQDQGTNNNLDYNNYYGPSGYCFQIIGTGSGDWNWYRPQEAHSQFADPRFVGALDFSLTPNSPCIDEGTNAGVTEDLLSVSRPQGAAYDIGAYEYPTGSLPTATPTTPPTATATPSPTSTPTTAPMATPTSSPTATQTIAPTATVTSTPTSTSTTAPTATPTSSPTATQTMAPTATATSTPTSTSTTAPTATVIPSPTATSTATNTSSPSPTPNPNEIIIDDTDAGFSTSFSQDAWREYVQEGGRHYGGSHFYNHRIGTGQDTAMWSFDVPMPGRYEVYAWWWEGNWRPTDAGYTINHLGGSTVVRVNQRTNGGQWNLLGTFEFLDQGSVVVSDDSSSGKDVVADAVRLVYLQPPTWRGVFRLFFPVV
jgi:hypothetical protein